MEVWKDIPGFEGRYQASDLGRIRSVGRMVRAVSKRGLEFQRWAASKVLKPGDCKGYLIVNLSGSGTIAVQILVARTFIAGTAPEVNHKNGIKTDNAASNLEWMTRSGNVRHAVRYGLNPQAIKVKGRPKAGGAWKLYPSQAQAAFNLTGKRHNSGKISACLSGGRPSAFGHVWERL